MTLPTQPVTLTVAQIEDLSRQLASLRHDVNNHLSLIMALLELIRVKPESRERTLATALEQPLKISESVKIFCEKCEATIGIKRN